MGQPDDITKQLDDFTRDIKGMINIKAEQFDTMTIATMISRLPERKWNAAQAVVNSTLNRKTTDQQVKVVKAQAGLKASANKEKLGLSAAADRTAWIESQPEVQAAELAAFEAEAEQTSAKLAYECLDDLFTAGKRIMQYLLEQDKATNDFNKFSNVPRNN